MPYFQGPSSSSASADMSAPSSASTTSCGANCACRTVSSVGSTTPALAKVQLNPYIRTTTSDSISSDSSSEDLLQDSTTPYNDPSKQDFDFDDVFDYNNELYHNSTLNFGEAVDQTTKEKPEYGFSFSHYSGCIKGMGNIKMVRTKSGLQKSRHTRVKSGGRRGG